MFKDKKYITFDCYGTLIDWESGIREALQKVSEKNNLNLDLTNISDKYIKAELGVEAEQYRKYHEVLQLSAKKLFKQVGFDISDLDAHEFANSIYSWQLFPETHEVLTQLKQKGYKLIILSNIDNQIIKRSIELMGINFDGVVTAEEVGSYKPAHGHWQEMLTSRFISAARLPTKAIELRQALRALGVELQNIPDWIGYIKEHLIKPDNYTTDGMPRTRFKAFSPATSYQYLADLKQHGFEMFELGKIDEMIKDYWDKNPEE